MSTNPTFQRFIPKMDDPKTDQAIQLAFKGLKDLNDAIVAIHSRTTTVETTVTNITNATTTTETGTTLPAGVNQQSADYSLQNSDFGGIVVFQGSGPYAVTLNSGITTPFFCTVLNLAAADLTCTSDIGQTINNVANLVIHPGYWAVIWFDGLNWWAIALPLSALTFAAVPHNFLTAYDAVTGLFTAAQPTYQDVVPGFDTTANRPASPTNGMSFFDSTLGKPIWWNSAAWVDATGTPV